MGAHLLLFIGVAAIVIVVPGPDTAVVTKNVLVHGRRAANPKIGIFFTSLLPQFVDPGRPVLLPFMALGAVFVLMTVLWLALYCVVAARAAQTLRRPRVKAALDRVTGVVLIGLGLRLAIEHR